MKKPNNKKKAHTSDLKSKIDSVVIPFEVTSKSSEIKPWTHTYHFVSERMCEEFNSIDNIEKLSSSIYLCMTLFLAQILVMVFDNPTVEFSDDKLRSFEGKLKLLEAEGVFDENPIILSNIKLFYKIIDYYARKYPVGDKVPKPIANWIGQLTYFDWDGKICGYKTPWSEHIDSLRTRLQICAVETGNALIRMRATLIAKSLRPL